MMVLNPLKKLPRNQKCPCGSGLKFKRCHLDLIDPMCTVEAAERLKVVLRMANEGKDIAGVLKGLKRATEA